MNICDNLFNSIYRYRKPENYLSSSLVFLLESLIKCEERKSKEAACKILTDICGLPFRLSEIRKTEFYLQKNLTTLQGRIKERGVVDIGVSSPSKKLVYIEVKDAARRDEDQLEKYSEALKKARIANPKLETKLILLARASVKYVEETKARVVLWAEIYDSLKKIETEESLKPRDPVSNYLLNSFIYYLEGKGMKIQKVKKDVILGLPSTFNLLNMLKLASEEIGLSPSSKYFSESDIGYTFGRNKKYYLFILWDSPNRLCFGIDPEKPLKWGEKIIISRLDKVDGFPFVHRDLEEGFFGLDAKDQLKKVSRLVSEMYSEITPARRRSNKSRN